MKKVSLGHRYEKVLPPVLKSSDVSKYMLMTEGGAITPWHVDFSGTSVFYILLKGEKEFLVVEPTLFNKELFEDYLAGNQ